MILQKKYVKNITNVFYMRFYFRENFKYSVDTDLIDKCSKVSEHVRKRSYRNFFRKAELCIQQNGQYSQPFVK